MRAFALTWPRPLRAWQVRLWDLRSPAQPVQQLASHTFAVRRVRFCPHSASQLLSASYDMSVCLWDVVTATHRPQHQYNHHSEFVLGVEWSLFEEGVLASCGWDGWLHVWPRGVHPAPPPLPPAAGPSPFAPAPVGPPSAGPSGVG